VPDGASTSGLASLFGPGVPASAGREPPLQMAVNLAGDPGPWLLRVLLAVNADHLAVLVPNNHPDLASQEPQRALTSLVAPKYSLRLRRSTPAPNYAVVEATAVTSEPETGTVAHDFLCRAHGKVGNVWREALIRHHAGRLGEPLTRNEARSLVAGTATEPAWLDARLIDLPRHAIRTLLGEAEASVEALA
jgi:hypothetical protein